MIRPLWRWHPKIALRYIPIVNKIKELRLENEPILEVGSGSLGIAPYLGKNLTGADLDFSGPQIDLLTKIKASAVNLPFENNSYSVVLMVDLLEHLPPKQRKKAISESIRVSKKLLIISVPCGFLAQEEDKFLSQYYQKTFHKSFPFFEEHCSYGLPEVKNINDTIKKMIIKFHKKGKIQINGNVNLGLHRFLMKGWMTKNVIFDIIFRKVFLLLIPLMMRLNQEPTYRKIFIVEYYD